MEQPEARGLSLVEKVLVCIGRTEAFPVLAIAVPSDHHKAEYLNLAHMWLELTERGGIG